MGGSHSREDPELSDSDEEEYETETEEENYEDSKDETPERSSSSNNKPKTPSSLNEVEAKLRALKLKYPSNQNPNAVKLYVHIGGNTPKAKWVTSEKLTFYVFLKSSGINPQDDSEEEDEEDEDGEGESWWVFKIGSKVRVKVSMEMQLKNFKDQLRVDFVATLNPICCIETFFITEFLRN